MLHLFLISHLIFVVLANPFQKYPYVFLLDVGNEEIGKLNTEQIRLTIPGGSLALRYPAVGEGNTIGHVRVSGIDFGTDLKASIIQGGPGYKYAVFVFMGNPGVPYDAVVTIQTVPNTGIPTSKPNSNMNIENVSLDGEDSNDSAEDMSDNSITKTVYSGNTNSQVMQSSSNVYQYSSNDADNFKNSADSQSDEDLQDTNEDEDSEENDSYSADEKDQRINNYAKGDYSEKNSNEDVRIVDVRRNQYGIYEAFKPHWFGGVRFYPQAALLAQDGYEKTSSDEDHDDEKRQRIEMNDENNYKDFNNNINSDYGSPVEY